MSLTNETLYRLLEPHCPAGMTLVEMLRYLYVDQEMSLREICNAIGNKCTAPTLSSKMVELGIDMRHRGGRNYFKLPPSLITLDEYRTMTYKEMAVKHKVHPSTIYKVVKKYIDKFGKIK